ncbi:glycosyltransferase [Hymenobacter sp. BT188]|uniref:glycosyltransferase n=1 Tax=Hymenobacter sp. BT188 TaxID=2763504 RepID=UPI001C9DDABE|nr:glycosyltransferase [Hymenobacter sp. BT188]
MPRFAHMLAQGMSSRGHDIETWSPGPRFSRLPAPKPAQKWLGYIDQYIVFPNEMRQRIQLSSGSTLFVFTDHALGPWVPLVANRPHVIHCHDFLAQRSALGEIPENPTSWTGRCYQAYIRRGYSRGKHFISVSQNTRRDLHRFLPAPPLYSEVVYNGLNQQFTVQDVSKAKKALSDATGLDLRAGSLLHVGGNQWYKNRVGILALYEAWRNLGGLKLPLLLIGKAPHEELIEKWSSSAYKNSIHWRIGMADELVRKAYASATALLFPSFAEGFSWPVAEAMASGCPLITTGESPMTEVGGDAAFYLSRCPTQSTTSAWARSGAQVIERVVNLSQPERAAVVKAGLANADRFNTDTALNQIEAIYQTVLETFWRA